MRWCSVVQASTSNYSNRTVVSDLNDGGGFCVLPLLLQIYDIVDAFQNLRIDFSTASRAGSATDIGRCRNQWALEFADQFLAERISNHSDGEGVVLRYQIFGYPYGVVIDYGGGFGRIAMPMINSVNSATLRPSTLKVPTNGMAMRPEPLTT